VSQTGQFPEGPVISPIETITGNSGGDVGPDGLGNIDIVGDGTLIDIVGNPGTNTLDVNLSSAIPSSFIADVGTATPVLNALTVVGGTNMNTQGAGNVLIINLDTVVSLTTLTLVNPLGVDNGGTGVNSLTDHSLMVGSGTSPVTLLGVATDGQLPIGSTGADPVLNTLTAGLSTQITNAAGSITVGLTTNDQKTAIQGWNGSTIESACMMVTSDGATITASVEKRGGGDLTVVFSDGFYAWDTTPADTVTLTAGSDTSPQMNYVYMPQATKTLTANTVGFPLTEEHLQIGTALCPSASLVQTNGAYSVHSYQNHVFDDGDTNQGHIADINFLIRNHPATWMSGVTPTLTIDGAPSPDTVIFTSTAGTVLQLHPEDFPAFTGTPDIYVVNDSVTPYTIITDLNQLTDDSTGGTLDNKFFSVVIWGIISEESADCKLMLNLPSGTYTSDVAVTADDNKYADYNIPPEIRSSGFLIAQYDLRKQSAGGGTWTLVNQYDLRGLMPSVNPGGTSLTGKIFEDNLFRIIDEVDNTKELDFSVGGITTATTRTITMADRDVDLNAVRPWSEETGISVGMAVNSDYIANNAALVTLTLPAAAAVGDIISVVGKGAGGWLVAQNAGQTIHKAGASTTTGVGGSIASTAQYDSVEMVCITANTDFVVRSSEGTITVT